MLGFLRRPSEGARRQAETVKALAREKLRLGQDATISVSEIQCGDASCPGTETVILVMRPGVRTRIYKVAAPLAQLDAARLDAALAAASPA
jgi:hypothetical protein